MYIFYNKLYKNFNKFFFNNNNVKFLTFKQIFKLNFFFYKIKKLKNNKYIKNIISSRFDLNNYSLNSKNNTNNNFNFIYGLDFFKPFVGKFSSELKLRIKNFNIP
jgi:hypothetical protein